MMKIPDSGRGVVRCLALAAGAILIVSAAISERAEALSLINPGAAHAAKHVSGGQTIEVRGHGGGGGGGHGGGGGGGHGGGFHGSGGFHGAAIHAGGFRGGGAAFHGGGFRSAHVFRGGGYGGYRFAHRHHRRFYGYGPSYYDYPYYSHYRRCRVIWTHYGPRRVCHFRHWHPHYWHHHHRHHRFHIYW